MDILFKNITVVPVTGDVFRGCVGVEKTKICYAGEKPAEAARVIDGTGKALIPGLYNCHSHMPMSLLRGCGSDKNLHDWLHNFIFPAEKKMTAEMIYAGALVSLAEMIASGTVSATEMYFNLESVALAVDESGAKANICNAVVAGDDFDFYKDSSYRESAEILRAYHNNDRIKLDAGLHAEYTSHGSAWRQVAEFAKEKKLNAHIHLSETKREHEECKARHGKTPTEILYEHGIFDTPVTAAHCVWLEDSDMEILARQGATAAHNPVSNLKLASGTARVYEMQKRGINVTLGTDGAASNNSQDLFGEIKLAGLLQKNLTGDPSALPAREVLKMATVNGAASQNREGCGQIAVGCDADLVMINMDNPRHAPALDPEASLVYCATGRDVDLTMCQGKILYENGEHKTIDVERALFLMKKAARKLFPSLN